MCRRCQKPTSSLSIYQQAHPPQPLPLRYPTLGRSSWWVCCKCGVHIIHLPGDDIHFTRCGNCRHQIANRVVALLIERAADEKNAFYTFILCTFIPIRARKLVAEYFQTSCWRQMATTAVPTCLMVTRQTRRTGRILTATGAIVHLRKKHDESTKTERDVHVLTFVSRQHRAILDDNIEKKAKEVRKRWMADRTQLVACRAAEIAQAAKVAATKAIDELEHILDVQLARLGRLLLKQARHNGCLC